MQEKKEKLIPKPPVVVVLGHIDHGKTTLLDQIKKTNLAEKEISGITQHLGAYEASAKTKEGKQGKITFLDTPGHEAFEKIRSQGAKAADLAILVIAADEGIKPQTKEALRTIEEAKIPFLIALNKVDKPGSEPERVKQELASLGILIEEWGGKIPLVKISAKTGEGIAELLEMILLMAEMEELTADPEKPGSGVVIETESNFKRGNGALLLIQEGTLHLGKFVLFPQSYSPVKILEDFAGHPVNKASFSSPVRIYGIKNLPAVGSWFKEINSKTEVLNFLEQEKTIEIKKEKKEIPKESEKIAVYLILKADAGGSLEALENLVLGLQKNYPELDFKILRKSLGDISEDDINLSSVKEGTIILGFKIKPEKRMEELASRFKTKIGVFDVVYQALDWLKEEVKSRIPEKIIATKLGNARILKTFGKKSGSQIIGGEIIEGVIQEKSKFKILRKSNVIGEGEITELEQNKIKTKEVGSGQFGVLAKSKIEIAPKDILEIFKEEKEKRL